MGRKKIFIVLLVILLEAVQVKAQIPAVKPKEATLILRHQSYPTYTRIVLEGDEEILRESKVLRGGIESQFSIEFKKKGFFIKPPTLSIKDGLVKSIEFIDKGEKNVLNIILEMEPHNYKSFFLKDPSRRVLDIFRGPVISTALKAVVVIDPGHGGSDIGARGLSGLQEKVLTLDIAVRIKKILQKNPDIKVILTRSSDMAIPLRERAFIGNNNKADLFISIHGNNSFGKSKKDFVIYLLPTTESKEEKDKISYLWDIQYKSSIKESSRLAESIMESLKKASGEDIIIKEAPLIGLMGVEASSVFVEIPMGPEDEKSLQKESIKNKIASNLVEGIINFIKKKPETSRPEERTHDGAYKGF